MEVVGEDMEIDRSMIELLADPLMHIVRNSLDHGIEKPEDRDFIGKPAQATVEVRAERRGGRLEIVIKDDGRGIDRIRVLKRARERGLIPVSLQDERLSDTEVFEFLFMPGFSTAEKVTDISGRGVGLDVVRSNVQKLKGTIDVRSTFGKGTTFRLSLPLTTAITDGIIVHSRGVRMVIPLEGVREFVCLGEESRCSIDPQHDAVRIRDEVLPLLNLSVLFPIAHHVGASVTGSFQQLERKRRNCGSLVVVESLGEACAIEIDGILGQAQVVTKPLPGVVAFEAGVSGTAVMGDGVIALVLDVSSIPKSLSKTPVLIEPDRQTGAGIEDVRAA
jgi:two-component system chemotaxis sensor kinase CheA